jgi:hypothetical protein
VGAPLHRRQEPGDAYYLSDSYVGGSFAPDLKSAGVERLQGRVFTADGGFAGAAFVNGVSAKRLRGMETPLADGDVLALMPPIAGG